MGLSKGDIVIIIDSGKIGSIIGVTETHYKVKFHNRWKFFKKEKVRKRTPLDELFLVQK